MNRYYVKEMKKMVKDFRHSDLKVLLTSFKKNSKGKKGELLERVNELIESYSSSNRPEFSTLSMKIFEFSHKNGIKPLFPLQSPTSSNAKFQSPRPKTVASSLSNKAKKASMQADSLQNVIYCPDVTLKPLPFYDHITELMKPTAVISKSDTAPMQYAKYAFSLTPVQVKFIQESEVLKNDCVLEYHQQVLLRFCLTEITSDQEDNYPQNLAVLVNQKHITLPNYNVPTNASVQPKRQSRPLDITFACILHPVNMNELHISWTKDPTRTHCFTIVLANRLNCDTLLKRLRQHCYRHPDHTRALVKEKLAASMDSEISFTCLKICLLCPLSKMKMKIPIRSVNCNHFQCYDAETFLQMNEKKPTWTCPICDKPTRYDSLIVDGLFLEILDKAPNATEIKFLEDGNWEDISEKKVDTKVTNSVFCYEIADSPKSSDSKDTIVLESKDEYREDTSSEKEADSNVIDLTGDSDEEPSHEAMMDSLGYLSSTSSSSATLFDYSKIKKNNMKLDEPVFQSELPYLDTQLPLFTPQTYNDPPELFPM